MMVARSAPFASAVAPARAATSATFCWVRNWPHDPPTSTDKANRQQERHQHQGEQDQHLAVGAVEVVADTREQSARVHCRISCSVDDPTVTGPKELATGVSSENDCAVRTRTM